MSMMPKLYSLHGLAVEVGLDRRAVAKLLRSTPPDGSMKGGARWRLSTLLQAIEDQRPHRRGGNGHAHSNPELLRITEKIEAITNTLNARLARLSKITSLDKRREAAGMVGPMIGQLDRLTGQANLLLPADERGIANVARDRIIGVAISNLMAVCEWQHIGEQSTGERANKEGRR